MAKMGKTKIVKAMNSANPPTPLSLRTAGMGHTSEQYKILTSGAMGNGLSVFRTFCRKHSPKWLADGLAKDEKKKVKEMVIEIQEWLDTLDQRL